MSNWSKIYPGNQIHPTAVIYPNVRMGKGNTIGAYVIIGAPAEHRDFFHGQKQEVIIGDNNVIAGACTIDAGTIQPTIIKNNCWLLKRAHVGHDALIEDEVTISVGAIIGGHCIVNKGANIGLNACIHQRKEVPEGVMIGMGGIVTKKSELQPNRKYAGNPVRDIGSNVRS